MTRTDRPSEIVARYIRFDNNQRHLHTWHCLQDCLEALRKWEAEQEAREAALLDLLRELVDVRNDEETWRNVRGRALAILEKGK